MIPLKILLVDDEFAIITALTLRLRAVGHQVFSASNGTLGVRAAHEHRPDVILLDIRMPDMDGYEVCRRIKSVEELASIPVVFVSANVRDTAKQLAVEVGGTAFVPKPFEIKDILAAIEIATALV